MSILDETVVKAKEVLDIAGKKTNDIISVQKMKMNIASMKSQLSKLYEDLGRLCYDNGQSDTPSAVMLEIMTEIENKLAEIKSTENKLADLRGEKLCPACGTKNVNEAGYCSKCGTQLAAATASEAAAADENNSDAPEEAVDAQSDKAVEE